MDVIYNGKNFRLLRDEELPSLLHWLSTYLPESLKFHQTLKTYLHDRVWDFSFYVSNSWPQDPICLHFPGFTKTVSGDRYDSFALFCPLDRLECLLLLKTENELIDWTKTIHIHYTHTSIMRYIEKFYCRIGIMTQKVYGDFYIQGDSIDEESLGKNQMFDISGVTLQPIKKEDISIVHNFYPINEAEDVILFEKLVEKLPSYAVYVDGEIVAWMLQSYYGAMFSMQTKPDYRRLGFGKEVAWQLTREVKSRGYIPYVVILPDNFISRSLYQKLGFQKLCSNIRAVLKPYSEYYQCQIITRADLEKITGMPDTLRTGTV